MVLMAKFLRATFVVNVGTCSYDIADGGRSRKCGTDFGAVLLVLSFGVGRLGLSVGVGG